MAATVKTPQVEFTFTMSKTKEGKIGTCAFVNCHILGARSVRFGSVFFGNTSKPIWWTGSKEKPLGIYFVEPKGASPRNDKLTAYIEEQGELFLRSNGVTPETVGATTSSKPIEVPSDF